MTTATRRPLRFLEALPSYLGGKRKLLGRIARALPRPTEAPWLLDPFMGGGSVSLFAKRRGFRVIANDVADRSVIVGRALIENDSIRLSKEDLTRLFVARAAEAGFVERLYGGDVLPTRHARFLDGALNVARETAGAKGALLLLLLMRFVVGLRPAGNWGAKTVIRQMDAGDWEGVNRNFLRDHVARAAEAHPLTLLEPLRAKVNRGVFSNGHANGVRQGDALAFLRETEGDVAYLDPPYGGTSSYEAALKPLDSILAGRATDAEPSRFSGRRAIESLEELFEAARHVRTWVVSYGNAVLSADDLAALVGRFKPHVEVKEIEYTHLAGLASETSRRDNREVLVRAWD